MDTLLCVIIGVIILIAIITFAYYLYGKNVKTDNEKGGVAYIDKTVSSDHDLVGITINNHADSANIPFFVLKEEGNQFVDINKSYVSKEFWLYLKNNIPKTNYKLTDTLLNVIKTPYAFFGIGRDLYKQFLSTNMQYIMRERMYNGNDPFSFIEYLYTNNILPESFILDIIQTYQELVNYLNLNKYIDFVIAIYQMPINNNSESKSIKNFTVAVPNCTMEYSPKITRNTNTDMVHKLFTENVRNWYSSSFVSNNCFPFTNNFLGSITMDSLEGKLYEVADIYPAFKLLRMVYFLYGVLILQYDELSVLKLIASYVFYANAINIAAACKMEKAWNAKISNEFAYIKINTTEYDDNKYDYKFSLSMCMFLRQYFGLSNTLCEFDAKVNNDIINNLSVLFTSYEKNKGKPDIEKYKRFKQTLLHELLNELQINPEDTSNINALSFSILK